MDTKWNSTDKEREDLKSLAEDLERMLGKPAPAVKELSPEQRRYWRRRKFQGAVSFLAFFLGMTLVLSSLGAAGSRIAWERDPVPRWETDWQNTQAFRDEAAHYLREFLIIGAGGKVDFYDRSYWTGSAGDTTAVVQEAEAYRSWWGFYPFQEAVIVDRGTALQESQPDSAPAEPEEDREPDEAYRNDKNVLYCIETAEGKTYTNTAGGKAFFQVAEQRRHASHLDGRAVQDDYNFYLSFQNGKVSIVKDGLDVDVYGNGLYTGESQWFVPGYDNFPVSHDLDGVTVHMAVRRTPERYYGMDYKHGGTYCNSAFYSIAQQVEGTRSFYKTQAILFGAGLACLALWLLWKRYAIGLLRRLARLTQHVWTEARFLLVAIFAVWAFLPGFLSLNSVWDLLNGYYWEWDGGTSFAAWGMAVLRFVTMNPPGVLALFWLCWLIYNDHKRGMPGGRRSLLGALFRALRARDLKRPVEKRLSRRGALVIAAVFLLAAEILSLLINLTVGAALPAWLIWTVYLLPVLLAAGALSLFQRCQGGLAKDLGRLAGQVEAVRAGDLERPLDLPEDADLRQTAESLNDIQAGMRAALEEQTRSERMKVELVSNVSHDLKTPLTSILSYAELLRQEDLPPAAADYAKIIDEKAQRLKAMVEDVFEVSRAAADQLPVHLEKLDLGKLLRQTLADMDGAIQESALAFKVELPQEPVMITADGKRLYRVFQNLIGNALRYALEGSRVYLTLKTAERTEEAPGRAEVSVRNTSRTELPEGVDFTARFVRGDASRTDGGSGLGLSIAKSFTEACGGTFRVETLADLFTAVVTFPTEGD